MENKENPLKTKSNQFALRIVREYRHLSGSKREYVLSKQLLRAGSSIGANVAEADQTQSDSLLIDCRELKAILISSIRSSTAAAG